MQTILTTTRAQTAGRIRGWDALARELTAARDRARAEAGRLLGPDRGE